MSTYGTGTTLPPIAPAASRYAGFWIRVLATLIDTVILMAVSYAVTKLIGGDMQMATGQDGTYSFNLSVNGWPTLVAILYVIGFWAYAGATPGKMLLGLRIVRADTGAPIGLGGAILRYIGYIVSSIVLCIGLIWVAFDARKQGWHDKIAKTVVVRR